ncbi:hypothetical protein EON80_28220 [bacterium]|nr:MAG: hypothetical protein EON80_28220 [bacterium]
MKLIPYAGLLLLLTGCTQQIKIAELEAVTLSYYNQTRAGKDKKPVASKATLTPNKDGSYEGVVQMFNGSQISVAVIEDKDSGDIHFIEGPKTTPKAPKKAR